MRGIVIRRTDGKYFQGCGYGGPGNPVPYFTEDIHLAQVYKSPIGAQKAAKLYGGFRGAAELDEEGRAAQWLGFIIYGYGGWRIIQEKPEHFEPNDYEGNNGPLKSDHVDAFE